MMGDIVILVLVLYVGFCAWVLPTGKQATAKRAEPIIYNSPQEVREREGQ